MGLIGITNRLCGNLKGKKIKTTYWTIKNNILLIKDFITIVLQIKM